MAISPRDDRGYLSEFRSFEILLDFSVPHAYQTLYCMGGIKSIYDINTLELASLKKLSLSTYFDKILIEPSLSSLYLLVTS